MSQTCCSVGCGVSGLAVALVPAYNEESYIASVLVRLRECVDRVIVCDDGSADLTRYVSMVPFGWLAVYRSLFDRPSQRGSPCPVFSNGDYLVLEWGHLRQCMPYPFGYVFRRGGGDPQKYQALNL